MLPSPLGWSIWDGKYRVERPMASERIENFYEVLGVPASATHDQIRKAYEKIAMAYAPVGQNSPKTGREPGSVPQSGELFRRAGEAYAVLSDAKKRLKYDQELFGSAEGEILPSRKQKPGRGVRSGDYSGDPRPPFPEEEGRRWSGRPRPDFDSDFGPRFAVGGGTKLGRLLTLIAIGLPPLILFVLAIYFAVNR